MSGQNARNLIKYLFPPRGEMGGNLDLLRREIDRKTRHGRRSHKANCGV